MIRNFERTRVLDKVVLDKRFPHLAARLRGGRARPPRRGGGARAPWVALLVYRDLSITGLICFMRVSSCQGSSFCYIIRHGLIENLR